MFKVQVKKRSFWTLFCFFCSVSSELCPWIGGTSMEIEDSYNTSKYG
jgi:hypothetical protein